MLSLQTRFQKTQRQLREEPSEETLRGLYDIMFEAKQTGQPLIADHAMTLLEETRKKYFSSPLPPEKLKELRAKLPAFARQVLNQSTWVLERPEPANCINAALNFSEFYPRFEPYSPMEFLEILQKNFRQLEDDQDSQFGDLIVAWSRAETGERGAWDEIKIRVDKMNICDPLFPYGLIFDHVMVRVASDIVFHKPDPTHQSLYQLDFVSAATASTKWRKGFELTYHRKIQS